VHHAAAADGRALRAPPRLHDLRHQGERTTAGLQHWGLYRRSNPCRSIPVGKARALLHGCTTTAAAQLPVTSGQAAAKLSLSMLPVYLFCNLFSSLFTGLQACMQNIPTLLSVRFVLWSFDQIPLDDALQLDDVLLHVDPGDPGAITVKLLCGWSASEDGLFSQSNAGASGGMPEYKAPEVSCIFCVPSVSAPHRVLCSDRPDACQLLV
jgi:hypothetical protein